jgi:uncharacterized repeat protein (TIGR01451 family)
LGKTDHNDSSDWITSTNTTGHLNPQLTLPFAPQSPISLSPTQFTSFLAGICSGELLLQQPLAEMRLLAGDGLGHFGISAPFAVRASNDLSVTISTPDNLALIGDQLTYLITVTNTGPLQAASVVLEDPLPPGATFVSATSARGVCANVGGILFCNLGQMAGGDGVTVTVILDAARAGLITNTVTVLRPEGDGYPPNNTAAAVTAVNLPLLTILAAPNVLEGNSGTTDLSFPVQLSPPCQAPVMVNYVTSDGTALAGQDYFVTNGTVLFPPGSTSQVVTVKVIGDTFFEPAETLFVNLSSPSNALISVAQARGRILNDDPPPSLFIDDVSVTESAAGMSTNAVFTVRLEGLTALPASVNFATSDGTAISGSDYVPQSGVLTFAPGVSNQTISVSIPGHSLFKSNATFSVILSSVSGARIGRSAAICTIENNPASELRLQAVSFDGAMLRLSFPTVAGSSYRLERADDLSTNVWTTVADNLSGTGASLQLSDPAVAGHRIRFYRVRLLP